jgi:hypothetical protein
LTEKNDNKIKTNVDFIFKSRLSTAFMGKKTKDLWD